MSFYVTKKAWEWMLTNLDFYTGKASVCFKEKGQENTTVFCSSINKIKDLQNHPNFFCKRMYYYLFPDHKTIYRS